MTEPQVSVIVPCHNRGRLLPLSLASLANQSAPLEDFEVLIVDDGSTDDTPAVVERHLGTNFHYFRKSHGGASSARNYGIEHARARALVFTDPDMIPCPDFVRQHLAFHVSGKETVVIGAKKEVLSHLPWWLPRRPATYALRKISGTRPALFRKVVSRAFTGKMRALLTEQDVVARFDTLERLTLPFYLSRPPDLATTAVPWIFMIGCNFSAPAEMLQQVGGFDEHFTGWGLEDIELAYRFHRAGARFVYEPEAASYHQAHGFSLRRNDIALDRNLRYFIKKHPHLEVQLHGAFIKGHITLERYENLVRRYAESDHPCGTSGAGSNNQ
jgi:glycosyltransferase involved in cell wall biosynthesis